MSAFDPISYIRDVRALPECFPSKYVTLTSIITDAKTLRDIREAKTLQSLNALFQPAAKAAKAAGDTWLLNKLKDEATSRKSTLEAK